MNFFDTSSWDKYREEVIRLRRLFHQIPELSYEEEKTCQTILDTLKSYGYENAKRVFHTGVVALAGDVSGECIALRMDIDGLPVEEKNDLPYRSCHTGKMHACGHDAHIAILLATAKILKDHEDKLPCAVKLIFQPGEEGDGGALPMITEGVLENPKVSRVFGAHVWPEVPVGKLEWVEGASFAGCDRYEIRFHGTGGHGAMPQNANSPLPALAEGILKITALKKEFPRGVVSACACHADGFYNVFPDDACLMGTIRTLTEDDRSNILARLEEITKEISRKTGVNTEFLPVQEYPPCYNDETTLSLFRNAAIRTVGEENLLRGTATFAAEDFAYFAKACPASHIRIGCGGKEGTVFPLHNPRFLPEEDCLMIGVRLFCNLIFKDAL